MSSAGTGAAKRKQPPRLLSGGGRCWVLGAVLLLGAAFRAALLTTYRFHPDEALFAALGRLIVTGQDPLLTKTILLVDKPPLFYYLLAGGISLSWNSELAARLPGFFASVMSIALTARLAWNLWHSGAAAVLAALLVALSPFAILFAPTAFADPLLVMWVLGALVAVTSGRWGWAGLLLGLAAATKQSGLYFLPLVVALGVVSRAEDAPRLRNALWPVLRFVAALGIVLVLMAVWDVLRGPGGFWAAGLAANNPGRLARPGEVWPRAVGWLRWLRYFTVSALLSGLLGVLIAALPFLEKRCTRGALHTLTLALYVVGYLTWHWLVAFPLLDRYMLPLVPLLALLAASAVDLLAARFLVHRMAVYAAAGLMIAALLLPGASRAVRGDIPVGGDHGQYDGIAEVAAWLAGLPEGSVVYDESLGWPLAYYLFDAPIYRAPFDSPAALTADLQTFGADDTIRVLVLPGWVSHAETLRAVRAAGFEAEIVLETHNRVGDVSFVVYRLRRAYDRLPTVPVAGYVCPQYRLRAMLQLICRLNVSHHQEAIDVRA